MNHRDFSFMSKRCRCRGGFSRCVPQWPLASRCTARQSHTRGTHLPAWNGDDIPILLPQSHHTPEPRSPPPATGELTAAILSTHHRPPGRQGRAAPESGPAVLTTGLAAAAWGPPAGGRAGGRVRLHLPALWRQHRARVGGRGALERRREGITELSF